MDGITLQDRMSRGLGTAARRVGLPTEAFRPKGTSDPLAKANRYLRLHAAFSAPDGRFLKANGYGSSVWYGVFDAAYTRPGDYLVQTAGIWFVAAQQHLLPPFCVQTNCSVSFSRPGAAQSVGINDYGGVMRSAATPLLTAWPASVLTASSRAHSTADLPSDTENALWTVLLPASAGAVLRSSDLMTDDLGRAGVVSTAELTALGWRLMVKQAST